jgi:succinate dehydrogenase / fumarate reductase cytochrome b subunit
VIIFVFLILHLWQFWLKMKMGVLPPVEVAAYDHPVNNLYIPVAEAYTNIFYVIFYVICMAVVGLHLWHGFWSAFQTLGLNHRRYTPVIRAIGMVYSVGMAVGFSAIPVLMYLNR